MRALVLSDIHGNLHALEAVLAAVGTVDQVWNLGDTVGYGAFPNEVIERIAPLASVHVRGNHDRVCCGLSSTHGFNPVAAAAAEWTRRALTNKNKQWLREMPQGPVQASARAMCAHGSPLHEDHYIVSMRDAWMPLQRMERELTFFGHTHIQGSFSQRGHEWQEEHPRFGQTETAEEFTIDVPADTRHLINPGSIGQPRDCDWRAAFAVYDDKLEEVKFCRVPYDVSAAQAAIRAAGLPERLAARLRVGR